MNVFDLAAKLTLDTSDYEKKLTAAEKEAAARFGVSADAVQKGVSKIQKGAALAASAGVAAVGAFATASVKTGMEFDSSMSQVAATMGLTMSDIENNVNGAGDTFAALRDKAREMGGSTIYSAQQAAEGLNILAMSGYDAEQSMSMVEDVLHLAAAGSMDMASAASYVSGAMKGFNDSTKDSGYYADLMAKGATLANTSVQQLGEAMASGAAGAAAYNQSADSMTVALLRLAEQGEVGAAAGTALAAAMKNIYTPTDQAKQALDDLGVSAYDLATGEARDFNDVVNELEASLAGMTDEEKNNYKQTIFGIQGLDAYNKMVVTGTDKQSEWATALASASDGMGAAAQQYDTMTDNLSGAMEGLKSAFSELQIKVSDKLAPTFQTLVEWLTKVIQNADKILPIITGLGVAFGVFAVAINISAIIQGVTTAMAALNAVMIANPIGIIVALIAGLVAAVVTLWNTCEGFRNVVTAIWEFIKGILQTDVTVAFEAAKEFIVNIFTAISEFISNIVENIKTAITEKWEEIKTNVHEKIDAIKSNIEEKWNAIKDGVTATLETLKSNTQERLGQIKAAYEEHGGGVQGIVAAGWTAIQGAYETGYNILNRLTGGKLEEIRNAISTAFTNLKNNALQWGRDLLQNFINGIGQKISALISKVSEAAGIVRDFLGFSEPKEGPLSNFHTYAPDMMMLFADGIKKNAYRIKDAFAKSLRLDDATAGEGLSFTSSMNYSSRSSSYSGGEDSGKPIIIQVVLDGKVIGETSYNYIRRRARMVGA